MAVSEHNLYSSYREALLEHLFSGEVMRHLWSQGFTRIEVLKPQVDDNGYDLVLEANGITRHVQLKSSHHLSATSRVSINIRLAEKPSGCIVWTYFEPTTLALGPFLWFGGAPGEPLPNLSGFATAKHAKGNAQGVKAERPNIRVVSKTNFVEVPTVEELSVRLFGAMEAAEPLNEA
jgi:hypothetical protein